MKISKNIVALISLIVILIISACNLWATPPSEETPIAEAAEVEETSINIQISPTVSIIKTTAVPMSETTGSDAAVTGEAVDNVTKTPAATVSESGTSETASTDTIEPFESTGLCDSATFVKDLAVATGTELLAGTNFNRVWQVRNTGTCTWSRGYSLVFVSGDRMGLTKSIPLPKTVAPGETVDITLNLDTPITAGSYKGYWKLQNDIGSLVPFDNLANDLLIVEIVSVSGVSGATASPSSTPVASGTSAAAAVVYDFAGNYCDATWENASETLACPGTATDESGFVIRVDNPKLSDGAQQYGRAIQTFPQWINSGMIMGTYPAVAVQSGDRFIATIGCLEGENACSVEFNLGVTHLQWHRNVEITYADGPTVLDIDLSDFAGETVQFTLTVYSKGLSTQDAAVWVEPQIVR
jgi:hypothetical protein